MRRALPLLALILVVVGTSPSILDAVAPCSQECAGSEQNGKRDDDVTAYVWKSTDFGATWASIAGNIPLGPVNVIAEDPTDARILYVGTDIGVYVTRDGGATWNVLGGNLPSTYVHDSVIHPRDRMIVAATHGRGIWVMDAIPVQSFKK